jgi:hypothetical protein
MTTAMILYMLGAGAWSIGAFAWPDKEALSSAYTRLFASLAALGAGLILAMALWTGAA